MPLERAQKVTPDCIFSALADTSLPDFETSSFLSGRFLRKKPKICILLFSEFFYHKKLMKGITIIHHSIERNQLYKTRPFSPLLISKKYYRVDKIANFLNFSARLLPVVCYRFHTFSERPKVSF